MIRQTLEDGFERVVLFTPAYDHRAEGEGRGQHVVELHLALVGPLGAVILAIFTGWTWADADRDTALETMNERRFRPAPFAAGLSWHKRVAAGGQRCDYLQGLCVAHGFGAMMADAPWATLIRAGEGPCWAMLRDHYDQHDWTKENT